MCGELRHQPEPDPRLGKPLWRAAWFARRSRLPRWLLWDFGTTAAVLLAVQKTKFQASASAGRRPERRLSILLRFVEKGGSVLVTRHNRPAVKLTSAEALHLHRGSLLGQGNLRPVLEKGTGGLYLEVLREDRQARSEE